MAITKERKDQVVAQYTEWLGRSQALILTQYTGLTMKQIDEIRAKVRENGGEFHIVKNTLCEVAFKAAGLPAPENFYTGSTAILFAFKDAAGMAKIITEVARTSEFIKIKGGYLDKRAISAEDVKTLAELPPLPVVRAQLMGTILAPASRLARTLAEPGRAVAAVIKAFADHEQQPAPEAAA